MTAPCSSLPTTTQQHFDLGTAIECAHLSREAYNSPAGGLRDCAGGDGEDGVQAAYFGRLTQQLCAGVLQIRFPGASGLPPSGGGLHVAGGSRAGPTLHARVGASTHDSSAGRPEQSSDPEWGGDGFCCGVRGGRRG